MKVILIRHGHAGRKLDTKRLDELRPLSARGTVQAKGLVDAVVRLRPARVISSPMVRCIQTAQPLADSLGLAVHRSSALLPDKTAMALRLIERLSAPQRQTSVALVTHGEVIGDVLRELAREVGVKLHHRPPGLKGCMWVLDFHRGNFVGAEYTPPQ